jgi:hypothetical protein
MVRQRGKLPDASIRMAIQRVPTVRRKASWQSFSGGERWPSPRPQQASALVFRPECSRTRDGFRSFRGQTPAAFSRT